MYGYETKRKGMHSFPPTMYSPNYFSIYFEPHKLLTVNAVDTKNATKKITQGYFTQEKKKYVKLVHFNFFLLEEQFTLNFSLPY